MLLYCEHDQMLIDWHLQTVLLILQMQKLLGIHFPLEVMLKMDSKAQQQVAREMLLTSNRLPLVGLPSCEQASLSLRHLSLYHFLQKVAVICVALVWKLQPASVTKRT